MVAWGFLWTQLLTNSPKLFHIFQNDISACGVLRCRHRFKLNSFVFILINGHSTFPGILSFFYSSCTLLPCIVWQLARLIPGSSYLEGRGVPEAGHTHRRRSAAVWSLRTSNATPSTNRKCRAAAPLVVMF